MSRRAIAIIDGEHYASVVRDALAELPCDIVAAVLIGGTEKLRGGEEYGVPLAADLDEALAHRPDLVVDLSDEPVLSPKDRFRLAAVALAHGAQYLGPDFSFEPPAYEPLGVPSLAVIGTGKRIGKTAVTGHVARLLASTRDVVVVAMGRGGPAEPEVVHLPPTVESLVELSRSGRHAASDHLETAVFVSVTTIGCRRCGGGLAGRVAMSNVVEGAKLAESLAPDLLVFDGSGAAIPPVAADRRILVASARQGPDLVAGYLNAYRILISDLVVLTMGGRELEETRRAIREVKEVPVIACELQLRTAEPLDGRRVAVFTTGAASTDHLDGRVVHVSHNLADRAALADELEHVDAEVFVVELKAAAVDLVAEVALARGVELVLARNDVVPLPGEQDLDAEVEALVDAALSREPAIAAMIRPDER